MRREPSERLKYSLENGATKVPGQFYAKASIKVSVTPESERVARASISASKLREVASLAERLQRDTQRPTPVMERGDEEWASPRRDSSDRWH